MFGLTLRSSWAVLLGIASLTPASSAWAGSKITIGRNVASGQQISMDRIDHRVWDGLLKRYVDPVGNVDYTGWQQSRGDRRALDEYLSHLSGANPRISASRPGQLAFWINAYNALTIKGILREYPTTSIRNHTARVFGYNIWKDLLLVVGDSSYSLEQIEHQILRKTGEPRIHFAVVCASHSCPRLLNQAYTPKELDLQLVANTRNFFANPENFRYANGTFYLSSILKWFDSDFGSDQAALLRSIAPYLPDRAAQQAASNAAGRVSYLDYDWSLNDQKTARTARR